MSSVQKLAVETVAAIKVMWQKGHLAAGDGNFSFKVEDEIWISPSGGRKCELNPENFVKLSDSRKASSEALMHKVVYEFAPKAKFVFHAHPTTAVAFSIARDDEFLPEDVISELILSVGRIPVVPYARPGSQEMGDNLKPYLPDSRILILKHHGALSWGETASEALSGVERLEHSCEILLKAQTFGEIKRLPKEESDWLREKRKSLGEKIL